MKVLQQPLCGSYFNALAFVAGSCGAKTLLLKSAGISRCAQSVKSLTLSQVQKERRDPNAPVGEIAAAFFLNHCVLSDML